MLVDVLGIKGAVSRETRQPYTILYCASECAGVEGRFCFEQYVSNTVVLPKLSPGCVVNIEYDQKGHVVSVSNKEFPFA